MTEDTIFRIYSMSKPITGVALMTLFDEGRFKLSDPVCRYLPEFKEQKVHTDQGNVPVDHDMTIRELMSHSGGLTYGIFGNHLADGVWVQFGPTTMKGTGFGLDFAVRTETDPAARRNAFWWSGMASTRFFVWPEADVVIISMTQRIMDSGILTDPLTDILVQAILP